MNGKSGKKAFLLTMDAMLALTVVVLVFYSYLMLSSGENEIQKASAYGNIARDILRVSFKDQWKYNYVNSAPPMFVIIDAGGVYAATGNNFGNAAPKNTNFTGHAEIIMYPPSPPPCQAKCNTWTFVAANWEWVRACSPAPANVLTKAEAEQCLKKSDIELAGGVIRQDVWVWKQ